MCRAIDVAKSLVNLAIERAEETGDRSYYLDFYKLHKLLYFAQKLMIKVYNKKMFNEDIEDHHCGALIVELYSLRCDFDLLTEPFPIISFTPISLDRQILLEEVLEKYHDVPMGGLVKLTKEDSDYAFLTVPCKDDRNNDFTRKGDFKIDFNSSSKLRDMITTDIFRLRERFS